MVVVSEAELRYPLSQVFYRKLGSAVITPVDQVFSCRRIAAVRTYKFLIRIRSSSRTQNTVVRCLGIFLRMDLLSLVGDKSLLCLHCLDHIFDRISSIKERILSDRNSFAVLVTVRFQIQYDSLAVQTSLLKKKRMPVHLGSFLLDLLIVRDSVMGEEISVVLSKSSDQGLQFVFIGIDHVKGRGNGTFDLVSHLGSRIFLLVFVCNADLIDIHLDDRNAAKDKNPSADRRKDISSILQFRIC